MLKTELGIQEFAVRILNLLLHKLTEQHLYDPNNTFEEVEYVDINSSMIKRQICYS